ncbi:MerR family transcriptional regulator [Agrococcus sp. 1P02AA]|uniref:MerR family transcriptional regulator n=1 Tax=Agrococcus sp. 1P02AA TaxID=3132259 RepID=UPI0039A433F5
MLSIGAFADLGQVSVRMLRHWDAVGLLPPAHVDAWTGYRSYAAEQLDRLHRIVALRDLGFGIEAVRTLLEEGVAPERLEELLQLHRATVEHEHAVATARLVEVERRITRIQEEQDMTEIEIITKPLQAVRLASLSVVIEQPEETAAHVERIFAEAQGRIEAAGGSLATPIAVYDTDERGMRVTAGYAIDAQVDGLDSVELPAVPLGACAVHLGPMSGIRDTWEALHRGLEARGMRSSGAARELYVRAAPEHDQSAWVTELQVPVVRA